MADDNTKAAWRRKWLPGLFFIGIPISGYNLEHQLCLVTSFAYSAEYSPAEFRINKTEHRSYRNKGVTYASGDIGGDSIIEYPLNFCVDRGEMSDVVELVDKQPYTITVLYAPAWRNASAVFNSSNFSILPMRYAKTSLPSVCIELLAINATLLLGAWFVWRTSRIDGIRWG